VFLYGVLARRQRYRLECGAWRFVGLAFWRHDLPADLFFGLGAGFPTRALFTTTTVLIALLAAGMAAQARPFWKKAKLADAMDNVVWDSGWLLSGHQHRRQACHTLIVTPTSPPRCSSWSIWRSSP